MMINVSIPFRIALTVVKTLNFGGIKSRLLLDDINLYIEITLPHIYDRGINDEPILLKQILDYRYHILLTLLDFNDD